MKELLCNTFCFIATLSQFLFTMHCYAPPPLVLNNPPLQPTPEINVSTGNIMHNQYSARSDKPGLGITPKDTSLKSQERNGLLQEKEKGRKKKVRGFIIAQVFCLGVKKESKACWAR